MQQQEQRSQPNQKHKQENDKITKSGRQEKTYKEKTNTRERKRERIGTKTEK